MYCSNWPMLRAEKVGTEMPGRPCLYGVAVDLPRRAWVPLVLASGSYENPVRQVTFQEMRKSEPLLCAYPSHILLFQVKC